MFNLLIFHFQFKNFKFLNFSKKSDSSLTEPKQIHYYSLYKVIIDEDLKEYLDVTFDIIIAFEIIKIIPYDSHLVCQ